MQWNTKTTQDLFLAIAKLENAGEAKQFFRDLLTEAELIEFGKRWQVAQLLDKQVPYTEIVAKTGLSSTTIARVSKWLTNGLGGYRLMLNRTNTHRSSSTSGKRLA